jgi:hypothetical protein
MKVKTTYLQMFARPERVVPPPREGLVVVHAKKPTIAYYRFLYDAVGREYDWTSRKKLLRLPMFVREGHAPALIRHRISVRAVAVEDGVILGEPEAEEALGFEPASPIRLTLPMAEQSSSCDP